MRRLEINRLLAFVYAFVLLGVLYGATKLTATVNPLWVVAFSLLFEQLFIIPSITKNYMQLQKAGESKGRFLPIFNEWLIFPTSTAKTTVSAFIVFVVVGLFGLLTWLGVPILEQLI